MFSLIITIIAIALVAALALATLYFGGPAFNKSSDSALAAKHMNEGQQVLGALTLYKADLGSFPTGTSDDIKAELLSKSYMKTWPEGKWELTDNYAIRVDLNEAQCQMVNAKLGLSNTIPTCDDPTISGLHACCVIPG